MNGAILEDVLVEMQCKMMVRMESKVRKEFLDTFGVVANASYTILG